MSHTDGCFFSVNQWLFFSCQSMVVFFLSINGCFFPVNQWLFFSCQSMVVFFLSINGCFFPVNQWLFFSCQSMVVFFLSISQEFVRKIRGYFGLGLCSRLIVLVLMVNQRYDNVV